MLLPVPGGGFPGLGGLGNGRSAIDTRFAGGLPAGFGATTDGFRVGGGLRADGLIAVNWLDPKKPPQKNNIIPHPDKQEHTIRRVW